MEFSNNTFENNKTNIITAIITTIMITSVVVMISLFGVPA